MDGSRAALILGLVVLLIAIMFLAAKIQKLHKHARHLRRIVQKLEGPEANKKKEDKDPQMGA